MRHLLPLAAVLLLPAVAVADAEINANGNGKISVQVLPEKAARGEVVTVTITVKPNPGCTTYPFFPANGQISKNTYRGDARDPLVYLTPPVDPKDGLKEKRDPTTFATEQVYKEGGVTWEVKAVVAPDAVPGRGPVKLAAFSILLCKTNCETTTGLTAQFEITDAPAKEVPAEYRPLLTARQAPPAKPAELASPPAPAGLVKKQLLPLADYTRKLNALADSLGEQKVEREGGLVGLLLTAAFWGLVSLATPCVFPMIPITVSLFLKQSNQSVGGAARLAAVYCLTIVVVLGTSAITLLSVFQALSINPWMNVALGALFVVFALSLFGMYEITLPNFLLRKAEAGRKRGGLAGTVFGAVAFSIVSFTCVAPFLGGFAGLAASGQFTQLELVLAGLTYAVAFASPFFVLALVPSLLKALPRSGGWMDTVKAVMGFLELAAALKFFRTAELRWLAVPTYFTYDLVLVGWVAIAAVCGLYLLGLFRLPHDEPHDRIPVVRLLSGLLFLGLGVYLLPGVFKGEDGKPQRPGGVVFAWVDGFLLPEPTTGKDLPWQSDLPDALKKANDQRQPNGKPKLVFVDFTGETCSNCKTNENTVFPHSTVNELLRRYELVQLYTDDVPAAYYSSPVTNRQRNEEAVANEAFKFRVFKNKQLPQYVIFEPTADGGARVVAMYEEGLIQNEAAFVEFLRKPLEGK